MSDHDDAPPPYNQTYVNAWSALSALVAAAIFLGLCFNHPLTHAGHWVWDLIRYIFRPDHLAVAAVYDRRCRSRRRKAVDASSFPNSIWERPPAPRETPFRANRPSRGARRLPPSASRSRRKAVAAWRAYLSVLLRARLRAVPPLRLLAPDRFQLGEVVLHLHPGQRRAVGALQLGQQRAVLRMTTAQPRPFHPAPHRQQHGDDETRAEQRA